MLLRRLIPSLCALGLAVGIILAVGQGRGRASQARTLEPSKTTMIFGGGDACATCDCNSLPQCWSTGSPCPWNGNSSACLSTNPTGSTGYWYQTISGVNTTGCNTPGSGFGCSQSSSTQPCNQQLGCSYDFQSETCSPTSSCWAGNPNNECPSGSSPWSCG
jgi:hypothetical protein